MRIGLLSDSHGNIAATLRAVKALLGAGSTHLAYLGDFCSIGVLDALAGLDIPVHLVPGNNDSSQDRRYAESIGLLWHTAPGFMVTPEGVLVLVHGHETHALEQAKAVSPRWLAHGHTHRRTDRWQGSLRILCPGSCASPRDGLPPACAILDTHLDSVDFFDLN